MRARFVIIFAVSLQNPTQMTLIENDQMIETFSANTSNYSFRVRILERRMGRCDHFLNLHPLHSTSKFRSINRISISE